MNIMNRMPLLIVLAALAACAESTKPPAASAPISAPEPGGANFKVAEKPGDGPIVAQSEPENQIEFRRSYTKRFLDGYTVKLTVDQGYGILSKSGEVIQTDGKWIVFSVDSPADEVLKLQALKDIQSVIPSMEQMDAAWRDKGPDCIVDTSERKWCRKP